MRTYTHLQVEELVSAVESLPSLRGDDPPEQSRARDPSAVDPLLDRVIQAWPELSSRTRKKIAAIVSRRSEEAE
jgi:hypothetical protein